MQREGKTSPEIANFPNVKAEFEQWYVKRYAPNLAKHEISCDAYKHFCAAHFSPMHFDMRQGVYLEFLRENGIDAEARPVIYTGEESAEWYSPHLHGNTLDYKSQRQNYHTAIIQAIEAGFARLEQQKTPAK